MEEVVSKLQKEHNLLDTVVQDFEKYIREVKVVLKGLKEKGSVPADKQAYVRISLLFAEEANISYSVLLEDIHTAKILIIDSCSLRILAYKSRKTFSLLII